jgi:hypothetical protein
MAVDTSLLDWLLSLLRDPHARAAFVDDPNGYLNECGFHHVSAADIHDALTLISDNDHSSHHDHGGHHYPPPPHHWDHHDDGATYLKTYVTNNYTTVEDHTTNIDNSIHQDIDTHGGDFDQVIDNDPVVASGDHSVAAGGDISDSNITTGDGNVVGDNNQAVTGDHNTTAFGSGDASNANFDHTSVGDGGALSVGGDAYGHNEDNDTSTSVHNSGSGDTSVNAAGDHGYADQTADQSHHDDSSYSNYDDHSSSDSHDDYNSHNSAQADDSHNVDIHHV